ncbi:hypothetical protein H6G06_19645 [Anabaena sphaerica FACHB-251]|uniref:Uncharacterized protein n=1 Tax=Anabaena sphaerica FACHB-251 TaxID=2692883 RepID=A0A927A134_9NOST|nr:hypothetical protein [Anabaena sphaerica]MBD2295627.1 hypothetical protein [Anabaena sphaerica FACHB-251]
MSSGSSSRYQSKVFNFINQHSQRLTQQWENTIRHLQVATKWSVEALLYPLYQMFQPDELAGKRLQTKAPKTQLQLQPETPPPADAPIQHVLELVKNLPSAAASQTQTLQNVNPLGFLGDTWREVATRLGWLKSHTSETPQPENTLQYHIPTVQGIAVKLENRNLVLVSDNNKVLDVLTIQQQGKLADSINSEVAEYWHSLKLAEVKKEQELLPEIDRILTKLTCNTNPSIIDLPESRVNLNIQSYPGKFLAFIDTALANLEAQALVPVQQSTQELIKIAQTQLDIFIYGREQVEARGDITVNADGLENRTLDISALIEAAINYFFGGRKIQKLEGNPTSQKLPGKPVNRVYQNSQLQTADLMTDSWLSWGDLFGNLEINADDANLRLTANSLTKEDTQQELLPKSGRRLFKRKQSTKETPHSPIENERETEKHQNQLQPDWIETTATFLGYERHPLEQILAWLDHVMLWIEMIFMNMIYFFKGLLQVR